MKSPSPAFSIYPKDVLSDEKCTAMTHAEFGMYFRLLMHAWLERGVPADPVKLQRLLGIAAKTFEAAWPALKGCWTVRNGRLLQVRMERERSKQMAFRRKQSEKGKNSGKSRRINKTSQPRFNRCSVPVPTQHEPNTNLPSPSPSPSPSPVLTSTDLSDRAPRANPFVAGQRDKLEIESLRLSREVAALRVARGVDTDGAEVFAQAAHFEGSRRQGINPANLTEDRLMNTVLDLRAMLRDEQERAAKARPA